MLAPLAHSDKAPCDISRSRVTPLPAPWVRLSCINLNRFAATGLFRPIGSHRFAARFVVRDKEVLGLVDKCWLKLLIADSLLPQGRFPAR